MGEQDSGLNSEVVLLVSYIESKFFYWSMLFRGGHNSEVCA